MILRLFLLFFGIGTFLDNLVVVYCLRKNGGGRDWIEEKILSFFEFEGFYFCKKGIYYEAKDMGTRSSAG